MQRLKRKACLQFARPKGLTCRESALIILSSSKVFLGEAACAWAVFDYGGGEIPARSFRRGFRVEVKRDKATAEIGTGKFVKINWWLAPPPKFFTLWVINHLDSSIKRASAKWILFSCGKASKSRGKCFDTHAHDGNTISILVDDWEARKYVAVIIVLSPLSVTGNTGRFDKWALPPHLLRLICLCNLCRCHWYVIKCFYRKRGKGKIRLLQIIAKKGHQHLNMNILYESLFVWFCTFLYLHSKQWFLLWSKKKLMYLFYRFFWKQFYELVSLIWKG